jgi:hypothetical protein
MKKIRIILLFGLMVILMAFTSSHLLQADPLHSSGQSSLLLAKKHPVPFNARINAVITEMVGDPSALKVTVNGSGNATHLGRIGFYVKETIAFDEFFNGVADQDITFTAANGDKLYVHAISNMAPVSADPLILAEEGSGWITGGTGRFEDASGSVVVKGVVEPFAGIAELSIIGIFMY